MKTYLSQNNHLPCVGKLQRHSSEMVQSVYSKKYDYRSMINSTSQSQISKLLREVRTNIQSRLQTELSLQKKKKQNDQKKNKKQSYLTRKQRKIHYYEKQTTNQNETFQRSTMKKLTTFISNSVQVKEIQSLYKPPHRTSNFSNNEEMAMCLQGQKLYIYGGLGCEPHLKLAILDLGSKKWTFSQEEKFAQYHPTTPISGHTFGCYKGRGFIYGGSSIDITNELSIVDFKNLKFTEGRHCHFRRKNHAMIMISKFMIIHGGIESNQVTNSLYFYNTETNTWTYPAVSSTLPYLASHAITSTYPLKTRNKQLNSLNQLNDPLFLFGGKNKQGDMTNGLYKIFIQNDIFIATKIQFLQGPSKRMESCFHSVGKNTIILYGGRVDIDQETQSNQDDSVSPVYSFNTEKLQWTHLSALDSLPNRYGMASTVSNGKIFVFGGFIDNKYANANITTLSLWNQDQIKSKSNLSVRDFSRQKCRQK